MTTDPNFTLSRLLTIGGKNTLKLVTDTYPRLQPAEIQTLVEVLKLPGYYQIPVEFGVEVKDEVGHPNVDTMPMQWRRETGALEIGDLCHVLAIHDPVDTKLARYVMSYVATHVDLDLDDQQVMSDAISDILWRYGLDSQVGFSMNTEIQMEVRARLHWINTELNTFLQPGDSGRTPCIAETVYDRRSGWLIVKFTERETNVIYC